MVAVYAFYLNAYIIRKMDKKFNQIYYSDVGYWRGKIAIKRLAKASGSTKEEAERWLLKQPLYQIPGGRLPYEEYMGVCHELGSHFQEKIPKRVCQFFTKIPERAIISVRNSI